METDSSAALSSSSVDTASSAVSTDTSADLETSSYVEDGSSTEAEESSSTNDGTEATQSTKDTDPVERRIRNLQSQKDREIAEATKAREATEAKLKETEAAFGQLEQMILANQYQQVLGTQGQEAADAMVQRFQMAKAAQQLQQKEAALAQREALLEQRGAKALAYDLAADPKYKGVDPEKLQRYAKFGAEAMIAAAEDLAMSTRKTAITERRASGADRVGSQSGSTQSEPLFGGAAIAAAYSSRRGKR